MDIMPLQIIRNDILNMDVDIIVNPTDYCLSGSASIDKRIHELGGEELKKECDNYKHCNFGDAIITNAYNLNAKYIIHTVGPFWRDDEEDSKILESCYINSLKLAKKMNANSIAFPLIATGTFSFPKDKALNIAINTINSFLFENDMKVYLVVYTNDAYNISTKLVENIKSYIDNEYVDNDLYIKIYSSLSEKIKFYEYNNIPLYKTFGDVYISDNVKKPILEDIKHNKELLKTINTLDESFGSKILSIIDRLGFTDVEVYKAAEMSRQLFQKIKNNENPSKKTALALCVVLPLKLDEVKDLLASAGYAFNTSNRFEQAIMLIIKSMENRTNLLSIVKINLLLDDLGIECF
jgi:O-acetyl-ADP-ribose deacetylase (regulator of RNase III)